MVKRNNLSLIKNRLRFRFQISEGLSIDYKPEELPWSIAKRLPSEQAKALREASELFEPFAKKWDLIDDYIQDMDLLDDADQDDPASLNRIVSTLKPTPPANRSAITQFQQLPESQEEGKRLIEWRLDTPIASDKSFCIITEYLKWLKENGLYQEDSVAEYLREYIVLLNQPVSSFGSAFIDRHDSKATAAWKRIEEHLSGQVHEWPKVDEIVKPLHERIEMLIHVVQDTEADATQRFNELVARQDEREKEVNAWVEEKEKRITDLEEAYIERLRLEAPEVLWRDRSRKQKRFALGWGCVAVLLAVVLVGFMSWAVPTFVMSIPDESIITPLFLIAAIVTFAVYIIRVFIKMALSAMHLSQTYDQKEALTHFLQALLADGGDVGADERLIIYKELFSSVDTGLVKTNDGGDVTQVIETAMKRP